MEQRQPVHAPQTRGGLNVPRNLGVGASTKADIYSRWETYAGTEQYLAEKGLEMPPNPGGKPPVVVESDLTKLSPSELTDIHQKVLAWFSYVTPVVAECKALALQWKNKRTIIETTIKKKLRTRSRELKKIDPTEKAMSESEIEDEVYTDPDFQECMLEQQVIEQRKVMVDAYAETVYQSMKVISRAVETHRQEQELGGVSANMPGRGSTPHKPWRRNG